MICFALKAVAGVVTALFLLVVVFAALAWDDPDVEEDWDGFD